MKQDGSRLILLLIDDLIFVSKVSIAAKDIGTETRVLTKSDLDDIERLVGIADLILVDLNAEHLKPLEFIRNVSNLPTSRDTRIVCFVSHINNDLMNVAKQFKGVTVLTRSQFVDQLKGILEGVKES